MSNFFNFYFIETEHRSNNQLTSKSVVALYYSLKTQRIHTFKRFQYQGLFSTAILPWCRFPLTGRAHCHSRGVHNGKELCVALRVLDSHGEVTVPECAAHVDSHSNTLAGSVITEVAADPVDTVLWEGRKGGFSLFGIIGYINKANTKWRHFIDSNF